MMPTGSLPLPPPIPQGYGEDDYLLFDCPGQIELYSHVSVFRTFTEFLKRDGWNICAVRVALSSTRSLCAAVLVWE